MNSDPNEQQPSSEESEFLADPNEVCQCGHPRIKHVNFCDSCTHNSGICASIEGRPACMCAEFQPSTPSAAAGYRDLPKDGTVTLQRGDQIATPDKEDWALVGKMFFGVTLDYSFICRFRRPIAPAQPDEAEGPTPETDAVLFREDGEGWGPFIQHARSLERQRNTARAEVENERRLAKEFSELATSHAAEVESLMRERDEAREGTRIEVRYRHDQHASFTSEVARLKEELAEALAKIDFLKAKGITVGKMKTSDKPEPYLAYVIREGSELCDRKLMSKLTDLEVENHNLRSQAEGLAEACDNAAEVFEKYASLHAGKFPPNLDKAAKNEAEAMKLRQIALAYRQANPKEGGE